MCICRPSALTCLSGCQRELPECLWFKTKGLLLSVFLYFLWVLKRYVMIFFVWFLVSIICKVECLCERYGNSFLELASSCCFKRMWRNVERIRNKWCYNSLPNRPVGTNLVLVQRVKADNLLSMKAERAKRAECLTAWGPGARTRAPGLVQGQSPAGVQGRRPGSSWVLAFAKGPERLSWKYCFL